MDESERFLLDFHRQHPGCTRVAFAAGRATDSGKSSYELLSEPIRGGRILDLGCGDGHLLSLLPPSCVPTGVDLSPDELRCAKVRAPRAHLARARAQMLPFASASFDTVVSHFAFHLMRDLECVVSEIGRVLRPGGQFAAIIGGGPKVGDPFELFLDLMLERRTDAQRIPAIGERRGRTAEGLSALFASCEAFGTAPLVEHHYIDFGGSFAEVWERVSTIYDLHTLADSDIADLRAAFARRLDLSASHIPCTMAIRSIRCTRR